MLYTLHSRLVVRFTVHQVPGNEPPPLETSVSEASTPPPLIGSVHPAGAEMCSRRPCPPASRCGAARCQWSLLFSSLSSHPATDICTFHPWRMVYLARLILQPQKLDSAFILYVLPPLILILQDFSYADFNLAYCLLCTPTLPLQLKLRIKGNRRTRSL